MTITCLGCGCGCDDLTVEVREGRVRSIAPPCPVAEAWWGTGRVPDRVLLDGNPVSEAEALAAAAELLAAATGRVLVVLAPDLTTEAYRAAVALADLLRATVDTATSATAAEGLLAAQRRGRAGATLGEIRNRADVILCWGVDPTERYPRYFERYGRAARTVISVNVGDERGPAAAELQLSLSLEDEIPALSVIRATVLGQAPDQLPEALRPAAVAASRLLAARYAAIVHDGEPGRKAGSPYRAEGLIALAQALNGPTRAALSTLRAGGNRSGVESVLTWQTGYPMAVDFSTGVPRYEPAQRGLERIGNGEFAALLLAGTASALPRTVRSALARVPAVAVGPRASESGLALRVAFDTGVAGIHEPGTGYRMDEVPLPLDPPLPDRRRAVDVLGSLLHAARDRRGAA